MNNKNNQNFFTKINFFIQNANFLWVAYLAQFFYVNLPNIQLGYYFGDLFNLWKRRPAS